MKNNKIELILSIVIISLAISGAIIMSNIPQLPNQIISRKPSYEYLKSVTVRLEHHFEKDEKLQMWIGTGVIVKITEDNTYILTNKHIAPIDKTILVMENNIEYPATVIKNSSKFDLALIKIVGVIPNKKVIQKIETVKVADKVYSVGMYLGLEYIYTEGNVAGVYKNSIEIENLLVNMPCAGGCSGSGIFNENGELVAILYAGFNIDYCVDTSKSICVPSHTIQKFLMGII